MNRRTVIASIFALVFFYSAALAAEEVDPLEANRETTRRFFAALSAADGDELDALYASDFEIWTAGSLPFSGVGNRAQALEGMRMIGQLFPTGLAFTINAMTVEGERVAVEAESDGLHVSGSPYHNHYHFLLIVRDGRIHQLKEYMDTQHASDVLLLPPLEAPEEPEPLSAPGRPSVIP